ncbi:hypothetical protein A8990_14835 [Paenibacillus taihuensis]|uniref:Uncharacterized protein n=1 Tax=Paenibacillus taihuensis TaxID=1156355 RepID=A0A3D9QTL0_9BACL|nr:hypothetical protein [Paenibacillus taihuensis]REE66699.1 hypothetical protein A8990_14835 [Paenibacillus taihuensis]
MKILLATYWAIPHVGGVWKYMLQLKERLEAMGHQVDMLGNSPDNAKVHMPGTNKELSKDVLRPLIMAKLSMISSTRMIFLQQGHLNGGEHGGLRTSLMCTDLSP